MARHARLRLFPASLGTTALYLGLLAVLCLVVMAALPGRASAAAFAPVVEYSFDEDPGEGTTLEDLSGNGHTATIHGAEWTPHGRYGGAMQFDGEDDYLSVPASSELDLTEELTLEAWIRPAEAPRWMDILMRENSGEPDHTYTLDTHWGNPYGDLSTNESLVEDEEAAPLHAWTHVAFTDDGAHDRLYVDGVLVDTGPATPVANADGELKIGGDSTATEFFDGRIDEVRIYDRVLTGAEVAADMEAPIQTPKAGPVAAWSFDEDPGEGETIGDESGHGHTATIHGAEWTPHGRYGGAMQFDGEDDYLSVADSEDLDLTEEFTLEGWIRPESSGYWRTLLVKQDSHSPGYSYLLYGGDPSGHVDAYMATGGGEHADEGVGAAPKDVWTHIAATFDGAYLRLYVDGELVATTAASPLEASDGELWIGGNDIWNEFFDGRIDEVRIYDRALNVAEVGSDMEAPIVTPKQGPVAAYSFDEGEGTTVEDTTGDGHTATIEDGIWTDGRYGGGIGFDGKGGSECVSVPDSPELRFSEEFTLEAWVKPVGSADEDPVVVRESSGRDAFGLGLGSREDGEAEGFIGEGSGSKAAVGGERVREYEWVHLAATWDGSKIRLYVDGELAATETATSPPATGEGALKIGCDGPDGQFTGRIDEVRVYNRTLDGAEVDADMESPIETPKATPVADYSFDEENEETQADTTGDGHTATVEGPGWTEHGRYGAAMEFDAAEEDVLRIPASSELDFNEEFTLEAWVRPSGEENISAPLIDKQEGGGLGYFLYEGGIVSDRPVGAVEEEQEFVVGEEPLPAHAWSHVALVFDGDRTGLYVDGKPVDNGAAEPTITSEGELEIGGSTDTSDWFDGRIDEVRIYNRALNGAEVAEDMEAPIETPKQGPIAAWSFEEGEGTTAEDVTGDEHEGAIEGAEWVRGKYGEALRFDGESDVLKVPNSPEFALTEAFTLEAWVRPESESNEWAPILAKEMGGGEAAHELAWWLYDGEENSNVPAGGTEPTPGNRNEARAEDPLPVDAWSHVALTYDGAQVRLYVDGELVDCSPVPAGAPPVTEGELQIGAATEHGDHFVGRIDEVRIYQRALDQSEIQGSMGPLPIAETESSIETNDTTAVLSGKINPRGGEATYWFEYGPTTAYGQYGPFGPYEGEHVVTGNEPVEVLEAITGLEPNTTYHYRLVAYDGARKTVGPDRTLTTAEPEVESLSASGQIFGVNYRSVPDAANAQTAKLVAESNATMFRVAVGCPNNEYDEIFEHAAEDGVTILPYIVGVAEHVEETGPESHHFHCPGHHGNFVPPPEEHEAWKSEVEAIVHRYGHNGTFWAEHEFSAELIPDHWEIWNEENSGRFGSTTGRIHPAWYGSLLEEAHEAITNVDPTAQILIGGLLSVPKARPTAQEVSEGREDEIDPARFLKQMGHYNAFDAVSLHPYAFRGLGKVPHAPNDAKDVEKVTERVYTNIKVVRARLNELGSTTKQMPIWISEIGWPVRGGGANPEDKVHWLVSEDTQRDLLNSTFEMMKGESKRLPVKKFHLSAIMYYNIADAVNAQPKGQWDFHCGLIEDSVAPEKGKKRKAWFAFQAQAK
ncbi:MAG TPA: LamG domain-containing protein [Solirubrobacterales bacterium]|jgi:hypothetical protein